MVKTTRDAGVGLHPLFSPIRSSHPARRLVARRRLPWSPPRATVRFNRSSPRSAIDWNQAFNVSRLSPVGRVRARVLAAYPTHLLLLARLVFEHLAEVAVFATGGLQIEQQILDRQA